MTPSMSPPHGPSPRTMPAASAAALQRLTDAELSMPSRLGYLALLLAALTMTGVIATLWATEPVLPLRAQVGFGVMVVIGSSWVAFALWVLTHRRILFARHSIVAGRMAVTFTSLFVLGALLLGFTSGRSEPYKAAAFGLVMLGAAVLVRAHRRFAQLNERRAVLEREIGRSAR
jgi:hypothetical protein